MTNAEIVSSLHKMVDEFAKMLENPILERAFPSLRITLRPDANGDRLRLTVGVDFVEDGEWPERD